MNLDAEIQHLIALADQYREYDEDDPRKQPLAGIVDEINRLREIQSRQAMGIEPKMEYIDKANPAPGTLEEMVADNALLMRANATIEGADAKETEDEQATETHAEEVAAHEEGQEKLLKRKPGRPKKAKG